jgi:hypothetical protein
VIATAAMVAVPGGIADRENAETRLLPAYFATPASVALPVISSSAAFQLSISQASLAYSVCSAHGLGSES